MQLLCPSLRILKEAVPLNLNIKLSKRDNISKGPTHTHTWYRKKHKDTEWYEDDEGDHQEAVAPSHGGHGKVHYSHVPDVTQSSTQPSSTKQLQKDTTTQPSRNAGGLSITSLGCENHMNLRRMWTAVQFLLLGRRVTKYFQRRITLMLLRSRNEHAVATGDFSRTAPRSARSNIDHLCNCGVT